MISNKQNGTLRTSKYTISIKYAFLVRLRVKTRVKLVNTKMVKNPNLRPYKSRTTQFFETRFFFGKKSSRGFDFTKNPNVILCAITTLTSTDYNKRPKMSKF